MSINFESVLNDECLVAHDKIVVAKKLLSFKERVSLEEKIHAARSVAEALEFWHEAMGSIIAQAAEAGDIDKNDLIQIT